MSGVTEAVPVAKALPGIVQLVQNLPLRWVYVINPLMGSYGYSNVCHGALHTSSPSAQSPTTDPNLNVAHPKASCYNTQPPSTSLRLSSKVEGNPVQTTVFHELLESPLPPHEKSEERLTQEGVALVSAAAETTSTTLMTTMFHVLCDPWLVARLRDEIRPMMQGPRVCPGWCNLESLPLLVSHF
jgi:hypothetical protein